MKKFFAVGVMLVLLLVTGSLAVQADKITLTVWDWISVEGAGGDSAREMDRNFMEKYPDIKVNKVVQPSGQYFTLLRTAGLARTGPDVVMLYVGGPIQDYKDILLRLDEWVAPIKDDLTGWDTVSDNYDVSKGIYGVPLGAQASLFYYNKDLFAQVGLDPDQPPKTWKEFLESCDSFQQVNIPAIVIGRKGGWAACWWLDNLWAKTVGVEETKRIYEGSLRMDDLLLLGPARLYMGLYGKGYFQSGSKTTPIFPDAIQLFGAGKGAMFVGLTSYAANWKEFGELMGYEKLGAFKNPPFVGARYPEAIPVTPTGCWSITNWCKYPKEAFYYLQLAAGKDFAEQAFMTAGAMPNHLRFNTDLIQEPVVKKIWDWIKEDGIVSVRGVMPWSVQEEMDRQFTLAELGEISVGDALENVQKKLEESR